MIPKTNTLQLIIAALLAIGGVALLFCGTFISPEGEIHESLLVAFGEVATFSGSILGIDYHYRSMGSSTGANISAPGGERKECDNFTSRNATKSLQATPDDGIDYKYKTKNPDVHRDL